MYRKQALKKTLILVLSFLIKGNIYIFTTFYLVFLLVFVLINKHTQTEHFALAVLKSIMLYGISEKLANKPHNTMLGSTLRLPVTTSMCDLEMPFN